MRLYLRRVRLRRLTRVARPHLNLNLFEDLYEDDEAEDVTSGEGLEAAAGTDADSAVRSPGNISSKGGGGKAAAVTVTPDPF